MDFRHVINDEDLPREWKNVIIPEKCTEDVIYLRCNISNLDDCKTWVNAFSKNTSTQWKSRSSKPNPSNKIICQKIYVCHHSAYQKRPTDKNNHNKRGISKNTDCLALLSLTVKVTTSYTKRTDPFIKDGLPGVISIRLCHSHPLDSPYSLKCLTPPEHVKEKFFNYFKLGMKISAACRYHENTLVFENSNEDFSKEGLQGKDIEKILNNSRFNPTNRMVQHWFGKWKKVECDPKDGSFIKEKLNAKISTYESEGTIIKYIDTEKDPFTMVIFTPIMQRIHESPYSKDMLFIDSTSCYYQKKYSITFLLSETPCGVVPCGVLVTKEQTEESFVNGFRLFQNTVKEKIGSSFYSQNYPSVILSDNFYAEMGVKKVWPSSISFHCTFHVMQNVSLWLHDSKNGIPKERKSDLLSTFQTILYCTNTTEAEYAFESAMAIGADYPTWQDYLKDLYNLKEKWCVAYRVGITTHFMSKHVEICIRLYKDTVLNVVKRYNIIVLLEFIASTLESFYKRKLLNFYHSKDCRMHSYLQYVFREADEIQKENIALIDEYTYEVPSENMPGTFYVVDIRGNTCNCKIGQTTKLCMHVAAVHQAFDFKSDTSTSSTIEDQHAIALIAVGEDNMSNYCHPVFVETKTTKSEIPVETKTVKSEISVEMKTVNSEISYNDIDDIYISPCGNPGNSASDDIESIVMDIDKYGIITISQRDSTFTDMLIMMKNLHAKFGFSDLAEEGLHKLSARLKEIKSAENWVNFLHSAAENPSRRRLALANVKVQPKVIQRRKLQMTRRAVFKSRQECT